MEEEYEKFGITEEDFQDALDPSARKRRKFTKEDAIYGMWAEKDSDEEDSRKDKKNFSTPLQFVSGGLKDTDADKKRERNDDYIEILASSSSKSKDSSKSRSSKKPQVFAGLGPSVDKGFAGWEKYTKGIGQKLLGKMGYRTGQGLGREGSGIAVPIEVSVRRGKGAIGAYGSEKVQDPRHFEDDEGKPEGRRTIIHHKKQWRKTQGEEYTTYQFKTVEEVLEEKDSKLSGGWDTSELSKVKVIDMTGKEARVLSGYHAMHTQKDLDDDDKVERLFDVAELRHNLDLLIEMSEARIIESHKKLTYEKNLVDSLMEEEGSLKDAQEKDDLQVKRLEVVSDLIERLVRRQNDMSLDECLDIFNDLHDNHYEDYRYYEMDQLAAAIVVPIMQRYFANWNPLVDPNFGWGELQEWKRLLEPSQRSFEASRNASNAYHNVLWEVWMPFVREAILMWPPRSTPETNPIIELISTWNSTLPQWMLDIILYHQVLPRLVSEIEEWDPTLDSMPVHHWIHPWLPFLDTRLEAVYSVIRQKLGAALTRWHPSDVSAKLMLNPWIPIFSRATMDQFLIKNILPKLQEVMDKLAINPRQQDLKPLEYVFAWVDLMPLSSMAALFEKHFFPEWLRVLNLWLERDPNLDEVSQWYKGWKNLLPEEIRTHPVVQEQLNLALMAMFRSTAGPDEALPFPTAPPPPPPHSAPAAPAPPPPESRNVSLGFTSSTPSFKELLEKNAHENGIIFVPLVGRKHEGKQLYKFGKVTVYIDKNVIFMQRSNVWAPVAPETLLKEAR